MTGCNRKTWVVIPLLVGVVILSGCIRGEDAREETIKTTAQVTTTIAQEEISVTTTPPEREKPLETEEPVRKTGKLVITEYSDFECSFCRSVIPTINKLKATFGDQIDFVYKHFPLTSIHPNAEGAALAAECARSQGKFWTYHYVLFENQDKLSVGDLKRYARDVGLNQSAFNECLDGNNAFEIVKNDFEEGRSLGVDSTPTFFVGERKIVGAQDFRTFEKAIMAQAPWIEKMALASFDENILSAGEESCVDNLLNQDEERPDCGGLCKPCIKEKDDLVECLNEANATLYYIGNCPQCRAQMGYFKDSFTHLNSVNCDKEKERCVRDGVRGYPTWIVSGKKYIGVPIDSIKKIAACE